MSELLLVIGLGKVVVGEGGGDHSVEEGSLHERDLVAHFQQQLVRDPREHHALVRLQGRHRVRLSQSYFLFLRRVYVENLAEGPVSCRVYHFLEALVHFVHDSRRYVVFPRICLLHCREI